MQQVADLLRVSRPYLTTLLDDGAIPYHRIGPHRRILKEDAEVYKTRTTRTDQEREAVLDEFAREAQEQGHGY